MDVRAALPTGVVTFLLSDVAGSTRLWEGDEATMGAAIARHYALLDAAIAHHRGVRPTEQGEGDSVVGAFASPVDAVAAALDAQRAFAGEPWPHGPPLRIRIALHTGEAQLRGADCYVGRAVIRCARLRATAHGGQTILSGATQEVLAGRLPAAATLRDLGSHRLKDLSAPQRIWQLCHPDLPEDFGPLLSLDRATHNLPVQLSSFVGREAELAEIATALGEARLLTLVGAGGAGKTRLALHAAADVADRHGDGVRWIELAPLSDPRAVPYAVLRAFGLVEEEGRAPLTTLSEQLCEVEALLVLDNAEHVLDDCARLAETLLRAAPGLRILVTSREPLGVGGERSWRVPSLDEATGIRLFVDRALAVRPDFAGTGAQAAAVAQICRRLDGLPLAIELAAARVRMMPAAQIAAGLDDRFRLLTGGSRGAMSRQRTLEASVAWSHDLLDPQERALLRRLSVFAGGFTLEAAEGVCAGAPVERYAVLNLLSSLIDKSLAIADLQAEGRYRLLETIRLFAADRLLEAGEGDLVRDAHRVFFVAFAERCEPHLATEDALAWLERLAREWDNFAAAAAWCQACEAHEALLRMSTALTLLFEWRSHLAVGGRWFAAALAGSDEPSPLRAKALWGATHVAIYGGDFEAFARYAPAALAMAEQVGDDSTLARVLVEHGLSTAWLSAEVAAGRAALERAADLGRRRGDNWAMADGLKLSTFTWMLQEDHAGLGPALAEYRGVCERLGNPFYVAWYHTTLGWLALRQGRFAVAEQELTQALTQDDALGGAATAGVLIAFLGEIEMATGRLHRAEERLVPFLGRAAATGDFLGVPFGLPPLARLLVGRGAAAEGRDTIVEFVDYLRPLGVPIHVSHGLHVLGAAQLALGDLDAADAALSEAHRLACDVGNAWLAAHALHLLGDLARRRGEPGRAEDHHHDALALRARGGFRPGVAESLEALAGLATAGDSAAEAVRLFGAAAALRSAMGLTRWPAEVAAYDGDVAAARTALGEDGFAAAWAAGESLSAEEVVAYASRARGVRGRPSSGWAALTPTELDVVRLAALGLTNPAIGERLFIAPGTVKTHLKRIFAKLDVSTRAELAAEATRRGHGTNPR